MKKKHVLNSLIVLTALTVFLVTGAGEKIDMERNAGHLIPGNKTGTIKGKNIALPALTFGKTPLYFIANQGQVNEQAKFYARTPGYTLWLTKEGLVFDSTRILNKNKNPKAEKNPARNPLPGTRTEVAEISRSVSRLIFIGANKNPGIVPVKQTKMRVNFFKGKDSSNWHCDVPTSPAVLYKELYKNIDLKVYGIEKQIEYDWIVKPGGDPAGIRFEYKNAKSTRIDKEGNVVIETEFGRLFHKRPVSYQERKMQHILTHPTPSGHPSVGGEFYVGAQYAVPDEIQRDYVEVKFKKLSKNTYGFAVGDYDKSRTLVIDPVVLTFSAYIGGSGDDRPNTDPWMGIHDVIAIDSSQFVYLTGTTDSSDFPTRNRYQAYQGDYDVYIIKIDPNQTGAASLIYSTYIGGGASDDGYGIAVDNSGNAYVTGKTNSTDFPVLNQYQAYQSEYDAFVVKINTNSSGAAGLVYSTYLGGDYTDMGNAIAVDAGGYTYVTGTTSSTDFPNLNQYQGYQRHRDIEIFVTKLDTTQTGTASLIYSTYLGGMNEDRSYGIAVDNSGNVYVSGYTTSTDFPCLNQYQTFQGGYDVFVSKIDTTLTGTASLVYSTYLGGAQYERGHGIAADNTGNAYVTGHTNGTDFPTLNPYQGTLQGTKSYEDTFIARIDTNQVGSASLVYSTYLGGRKPDIGRGIAVDGSGNVYLTGTTYSGNFPTLNPFQERQGDADVFVAKIDTNRAGAACLVFSTYLGGANSSDFGFGIAIDSTRGVYAAGFSFGPDFPTLNPYRENQGGWDAFLSKLIAPPLSLSSPNGGENWQIGTTRDITWSAIGISGDLKISLWKDGVRLGLIAWNLNPVSGSFSWAVGQHSGGTAAAGTGYTIKIKEQVGTRADISDTTFTLSD